MIRAKSTARTMTLAGCALAAILAGPAWSQSGIGRPVYSEREMMLDWPLSAANQRYSVITEETTRPTVEKLAEFSREYRDTVNPQVWGRIIGNSAHDKSMAWLASEFRGLGFADVREKRLDLPEQVSPKSWSLSLASGARQLQLGTAIIPSHGDRRRLRDFDLDKAEVVYAGLGTAADFAGRDVKGKVVMIYSQPQPGLFSHSAQNSFGSIERAEAAGAAAIILTVGLPGNISGQALVPRGQTPVFVVGLDDFNAARTLIEETPTGGKVTADATLRVERNAKAQTTLVMGVLPGQTNEAIIVSAHVDGYYEAAYDNGGGVGALMALARYYAKLPQSERRRTIYFVANPGHHEPHRVGTQWMLHNMQDEFKRTAAIINIEHIAYIQALMFPKGQSRYSSGSMAMAWYAGGSDAFRKLSIDAMRDFGIGTYFRPQRENIENPGKVTNPYGIVTYGAPPSDLMDLTHLAPFFQAISADWPYHTTADKVEIVHWPALVNITRAHAKMIDDINKFDLKDLQGPGHPLDPSKL